MSETFDEAQAYDLIAIGGGPAAESGTELASFFGHRSLIIERNRPGGTVTTTGGVPTKTLREAALYVTGFRDRDVYGLHMDTPPEIALEAIRKRTWAVSESLQRLTSENIAKRGVDYLQGSARLGPDRTVSVTLADGRVRRLKAKHILIATGSRPVRPGHIQFAHPGICDTDTILSRGHPPKALLIVGGGPVAVEFATIARALDIRVTMVNKGERLLGSMEREMSSRLGELFSAWGVKVVHHATIERVSARGDWLEAYLTTGEKLEVDTILFASGRVANTEDLGLDTAGVKLDTLNRIRIDECFRTSAPGISAAGDVVRPTLASIAMEQGRVAVCHAFGIPFEGTVDPTPVSAVYGMPELAGAGLTEEKCREQSIAYEVGRSDLALTPRGAIAGRGGLLKLIFRTSNRKLVGVHCIGDIASEIVGIGQMAIRCEATLDTIANMSMGTPTYSYAYKYAAFDGLRRLAAARTEMKERSMAQATESKNASKNPPRTYNQVHSPRKYTAGKRRVSIYLSWSYPGEAGREVRELDNRYSTMTEVRRVEWPHWEGPQWSNTGQFLQGIDGSLELFFHSWVPFQQVAWETTGHPIPVYQRVDQAGYQLPIDDRVLADTDTLILFGLDHTVTGQTAGQEEIEALREFLSQEGKCLILGPHHDVGASPDMEVRDVEYRHHGDALVPRQQRFAGYIRSLTKALGVPVENQWGLRPAIVAGSQNEIAPLNIDKALDSRGWLNGVTTFNFHKHLPHYAVTDESAKSVHVLAKQPIDISKPHPFTQAGNKEFNAFVWVAPGGKRAADVLFADSTIFSTLFGSSESLKRFWQNIVMGGVKGHGRTR